MKDSSYQDTLPSVPACLHSKPNSRLSYSRKSTALLLKIKELLAEALLQYTLLGIVQSRSLCVLHVSAGQFIYTNNFHGQPQIQMILSKHLLPYAPITLTGSQEVRSHHSFTMEAFIDFLFLVLTCSMLNMFSVFW